MFKAVGCLITEHDLGLVCLSALICVLGCFTMATLLARAGGPARGGSVRWLVLAALVFGCSVWSLHFVAMLAFMPGQEVAYELGPTALSIVVAGGGALAALLVWHAPLPGWLRASMGGALLGLAVSGMHFIGVAAMHVAGVTEFDRVAVVSAIAVCVAFSILALARAGDLSSIARRFEMSFWLSLGICGLHFTGMASMTLVVGAASPTHGLLLGTPTLALVVGSLSLVILLASLAATLLEQHLSLRTLLDLERMRLMSNLAQEVLLIHCNGRVLEVNAAGERMFRAPATEIIGLPIQRLFTASSQPALERRGRCPPALRLPEEIECQAVDGTSLLVELSCQIINYMGRPATVMALRDQTDRKRDEARIRHLAGHDALTALPNRYTLLERLEFGLDAAAQARTGLAVVYIDLDRFKPINDLHGHAAGDAVLVQVAERILAEIRPTDTLARIGGDEFVMLLTGDWQPERVAGVARRVIETLRRPFQVEGQRLEISASAGIALFPQDGASTDALMRSADAAMYRAKEAGRGALRFHEPSMNVRLQERLQLEQELAHAVALGELLLHYQPIVNGFSGEVETFEALIRWHHPRRGMVPPAEFIPLAERTGLIDQIGRWVIETACRDAASWSHPWRVSVNVSPVQFHHSDVCEVITRCLDETRMPAGRVVVEVTEGILIDDAARAVATLQRLRDIGVRIALDDFGTGYSSLSYLQLFKFDKLKVDKSFVRKLGESEDALTLTRTIVNLGHNLGLQVTAEGVETAAQLAILREMGCDQIQGYLVARPGPMAAFQEEDRARCRALFQREHPIGRVTPFTPSSRLLSKPRYVVGVAE